MSTKIRKASPAGNGSSSNIAGSLSKRTQQKVSTPTKIAPKSSPIMLIPNETARFVLLQIIFDGKSNNISF